MPPSVFIADVTGATLGANTVQTFVPSVLTKPGNCQIAIVAVAPQVSHVDTANNADGWEEIASLALTSSTIVIARRMATADDPAMLTLNLTAAATWVASAMETYSALDPAATVVGAAAGANVAASTNFVCPTQTLLRYSDLYIGIVVVTSAAVAVTNPGGTTERHEHTFGGARALEVFDLLTEAPGFTGTKTATTAGAQTGSAASIALSAEGMRGGGKTLSNVSPVPGMIGLPGIGV